MAKKPKKRDRDAERVTKYRLEDGREVTAETCDGCNGKGCEFCNWRGFTIQESLL